MQVQQRGQKSYNSIHRSNWSNEKKIAMRNISMIWIIGVFIAVTVTNRKAILCIQTIHWKQAASKRYTLLMQVSIKCNIAVAVAMACLADWLFDCLANWLFLKHRNSLKRQKILTSLMIMCGYHATANHIAHRFDLWPFDHRGCCGAITVWGM